MERRRRSKSKETKMLTILKGKQIPAVKIHSTRARMDLSIRRLST